jgi:HD-GYP domain-containing protein (c-di-GMP phosphodiesterase class II)
MPFGRERPSERLERGWRAFAGGLAPPYELDRILLAALDALASLLPADGYDAYVADGEGAGLSLRATRTRAGMPAIGPNYAGLVAGAPVRPAPLEAPRLDPARPLHLERGEETTIWLSAGRATAFRLVLPPRAGVHPGAQADLEGWAARAAATLDLAVYLDRQQRSLDHTRTEVSTLARGMELALGSPSFTTTILKRGAEALLAQDAYLVQWSHTGDLQVLWTLEEGSELVRAAPPQELLALVPTGPRVVSVAELSQGGLSLGSPPLTVIPLTLGDHTRAVAVFARRASAPPDSRMRSVLPELTVTLTRAMNQERRRMALGRSYLAGLAGLADLLDASDPLNLHHSRQVADVVRTVGRELGLQAPEVEALGIAGRLHDIGMVAIDLNLPLTEGPLSEASRDLIRSHPDIGANLIQGLPADVVSPLVARAVREHHERWDGLGYPQGLQAAEISVPGQILALAEQFIARVSARPYRDRLSVNQALAELIRLRGTVLAPEPTDALIAVYRSAGVHPDA